MDPTQQPQQQPIQPQPQQQPVPITPSPVLTPQQLPQQLNTNIDPGSTFGVIGLVMAFFIAPIGIVLSAIGLSKSKKSGFKNNLALAGIIVGSIVSVLVVLSIILLVSSAAGELEEFKKDCEAKNGTFLDTGSGTYKCTYKELQ